MRVPAGGPFYVGAGAPSPAAERKDVSLAIRALPVLLLIAALPGLWQRVPFPGDAPGGEAVAPAGCVVSAGSALQGLELPLSDAHVSQGPVLTFGLRGDRTAGPRSVQSPSRMLQHSRHGAGEDSSDVSREPGRSSDRASHARALEAARVQADARTGFLSHGSTAPPLSGDLTRR